MNEITESRITEINKLQEEIASITKQVFEIGSKAVANAQKIGQLLLEQQAELQKCHNVTFADWIKQNCSFDTRTGYRYIDLYKYRDKINNNGSFLACYNQIDQIKEEERKLIEDKAQERVKEYRETGVKPDGWRRGTDDNILKQQIEEESTQGAFDIFGDDTEESPLPWETPKEEEKSEGRKRFEELQQRQRAEEERQKELERKRNLQEKINEAYDDINTREQQDKIDREQILKHSEDVLNRYNERQNAVNEWKEKIRLTSDSMEDDFMNAALEHLAELPNDNERLSFCTDVIKVFKSIASDLNEKIYKESV